MSDFMKTTCALCPFSRSKTLVLHPERAEEFAIMATNPYNDFPCHKTADEVEDGEGSTHYVHGETSKTCHGFRALQLNENGGPDGDFTWTDDGFSDYGEMIDHHLELWEAQNG